MRLGALLAAWLSLATGAGAAPIWTVEPCLGVDCAATPVGVGQADLLPDLSLSRAVALAQAVRSLSAGQYDYMSVGGRAHSETAGQRLDNAVKGMVRSAMGAALTKVYGDAETDVISTAVEVRPREGMQLLAQELVDESSATLFMRVILAPGGAAAPAGFEPWRGGRVRLMSEDVRVGGRNEFSLWVEDAGTGLTWVEHWPTGGGDLLKDGRVAAQYRIDPAGRWVLFRRNELAPAP